MRNATIATSRTRATTDQLIDYRPLPAEWGDLEALHALRAEKSRAAAHGLDASTLEIERVPAERSHRTARPGRLRGLLARYLVSTPMDGVWSLGRVWLCCPAINGPGGVAARSRDTR